MRYMRGEIERRDIQSRTGGCHLPLSSARTVLEALSRTEGLAGQMQAIEKVEYSWSAQEGFWQSRKRRDGSPSAFEEEKREICIALLGGFFKTGLTSVIVEFCEEEKRRRRGRRRGDVDI